MNDFLFARSQMAMSLAFHTIFAALGIGLPVLMAIAKAAGPVVLLSSLHFFSHIFKGAEAR
jgi:cytochrome bd-type quinol oxidase subunit 1